MKKIITHRTSQPLSPSSNTTPAPDRPPLISRSNMQQQQPPTIPLRHKSTFQQRRIADSSELSPSPHSSIFEAYRISPGTSEETERKDENNEESKTAEDEEEGRFRYGRGTILETIIEKKSNMTMSTIARTTRSADDLSSLSFIITTTQQQRDAAKLRRKQSFSVDDLLLINRSYNNYATANNQMNNQPPHPNDDDNDEREIYAQPRAPLQSPPERPKTPPGMPSWTSAQVARPGRLSDRRPRLGSRFQRFFGVQTIQSEQGISSRQISAGRRIPRFRPPRSVYGNIDAHPFAMATMAKPQQPIGLPRPTGLRRPGQNLQIPPAIGDSSEFLSFHTAREHGGRGRSIRDSGSKVRQCPHRKGRVTECRESHSACPSISPSQTSSPSRHSGTTLNVSTPGASTDRLMGSTLPSSKSAAACWKCKLETVGDRVDKVWLGSAMFLCYICCGVEFDDEDVTENRRRVLESTPVANG